MHADLDAPASPEITVSVPLDAATVLQLQSVRGYPCISLLLTTTPGARMHPMDRATLESLVSQARRRVREEAPPRGEETLAALDAAVAEVARRPVHAAVGIFVNPDVAQVVDLPQNVATRCVVDPTFATRDLVRSLHRTPRHVVLMLGEETAQLLDSPLGALTPVPATAFTARAPAFLRDVDRALGAYLRVHPAPVVLAGAPELVEQFRANSANLGRLAGVLPGDHRDTPLDELAGLIRPVIEGYLLSREAEAMELLAARRAEDRAAIGIDACWHGSRWRRPEMLAVEETFFYPAWVSEDGEELTPTNDPAEMGAIDDVVDELIEAVLSRGGWVALVQDGAIPEPGGVALTFR